MEKKRSASIEELVSNGNLKELIAVKKQISANIEAKSIDLKKIDIAIAKKDTLQKLPLITTIITKEEVFKHYLEIQGSVKTKQNILFIDGVRQKDYWYRKYNPTCVSNNIKFKDNFLHIGINNFLYNYEIKLFEDFLNKNSIL